MIRRYPRFSDTDGATFLREEMRPFIDPGKITVSDWVASTPHAGIVESAAKGRVLPLVLTRAVLIINSFGCWVSAH